MEMGKNILLVRHGDFFFYLFQMAEILKAAGHKVTVLNSYSRDIEPLYQNLIDKTRALGVRCLLVPDNVLNKSRIHVRLKSFLLRCGLIDLKKSVITKSKVRDATKLLCSEQFDTIIAYDPVSVFLACKLFWLTVNRIIDYSLEVYEEDNPFFQSNATMRAFVHFERRVLPRLNALLIQDCYREALMLKHTSHGPGTLKVIHFPVSVRGPAIRSPIRGLYDTVLNDIVRTRILFFGGLWSASLLQEMRNLSARLADDEIMIIHGGRGSICAQQLVSDKLIVIREPVVFDQLDSVISSAHIGLALYPRDPNCCFTAYSSEKIARYTKSGLPFIAFRNEDYEHLRKTTGCCVLVDSFEQIPDAIRDIRENYEKYRANAFRAFHEIYDTQIASRELIEFLAGQ